MTHLTQKSILFYIMKFEIDFFQRIEILLILHIFMVIENNIKKLFYYTEYIM